MSKNHIVGAAKIAAAGIGPRTLSLLLAVTCVALVTACADNAPTEATAEADAVRGDWAVAIPLFEEADAAHPGVAVNQFNLATAYENTGQNAKAIALYEAVVIDGQITPTSILPGSGRVRDPKTAPDLSAEATRRMAIMASRKALADQLALMVNRSVVPAKKVLICDFKNSDGEGTKPHGQIIVYVDDDRQTASTLGFFLAAPNQQEVNRFDSKQIVWTQRYQLAGRTDTYRYALNRPTASLDVTRPFPDTSKEAKATASCHASSAPNPPTS
jgi:hypothetical protein